MEMSSEGIILLKDCLEELEREGRLRQEKEYMQHGTTSVYEHSMKVAYTSLYAVERLHLRVDKRSLVRGALLHDYFLYDWHENDKSHRLHGFYHAGKALKNASADYTLNRVERNIIARHMFPLNLIPPHYKEAWIVCMADKFCAGSETMQPFFQRFREIWQGL